MYYFCASDKRKSNLLLDIWDTIKFYKCNKKKRWNEHFDLYLCYNQKTWEQIISIVVTTFSLYGGVCFAWIVSIYVYLPAHVSMESEKLSLCPIKTIPLCAPAVFPLKSKMLMQQQQQQASFSSHLTLTVVDFSGIRFWSFLLCWIGSSSAQPYEYTGNQRFASAIIQANTQNTNRYMLPDICLVVSVEWGEERDRHKQRISDKTSVDVRKEGEVTEMLSSFPCLHFVWGHTGIALSMTGVLMAGRGKGCNR